MVAKRFSPARCGTVSSSTTSVCPHGVAAFGMPPTVTSEMARVRAGMCRIVLSANGHKSSLRSRPLRSTLSVALHARPVEAARGSEEEATDTDEVMRRILATYEAGDLVTTCAWCKRVTIDGEWFLAPRAALTAIDSPLTLSHSICPQCALAQRTPALMHEIAQP